MVHSIVKVDEMGMVVLKKELREKLDIKEHDSVEFFIDEEKIIVKKHVPCCIFCGSVKDLIKKNNRLICEACIEELCG